jgi:hypothetical protein
MGGDDDGTSIHDLVVPHSGSNRTLMLMESVGVRLDEFRVVHMSFFSVSIR